jgi:dihydroxyacetone kinase-like predicted kinase
VRPAQGSRPSSGEIAEAVLASGTADVIVLPNDPDALLAARLAAGLAPLVTTSVVATRNAAEGVVAALAFDAALPATVNVERMEQAARRLHSYSVSRAVRDAVVEGVAVRAGQYMVIAADSRLVACADDLVDAALEGIADHPGGAELVTLYVGEGMDPSLVESVVERLAHVRPGVEVEVLEGGQRQSSLLVSVE